MLLNPQELSLIAAHRPADRPHESLLKAAVAIILRDTDRGTEVLMMQRANHAGDPWSGQMAFPGGKIDPVDTSSLATAIRETQEEVGFLLSEDDYIGQLDDLYGLKVNNQFSVHVACFVFKPVGEVQLTANYEVADMLWLPLSYLQDPENAHDYYHPHDLSVKMPAVMINPAKKQILWGLSLRMLSIFFTLIGREMDVLTEHEERVMEDIEKRNIEMDQDELASSGLGGST